MSRVSIIIPTYKREALLRIALDSIFAQTYQDFEIIVIDDEGGDNTEQLVRKYGNKVRYIRVKHSGLPSVARNVGLRAAHGKYISFLDSDDQWFPQKLERHLSIFEACPNVGLVCGNASVLTSTDNSKRLYLQNYQHIMKGNLLAELLDNNFIITSSCTIRRSVLDLIGGFSEEPLLRVGEDYDLWLRAALATEICYIPDPLVVYRDQGDSIRSHQTRVSYWQGMLLILDRLKMQMRESCPDDNAIMALLEEKRYTYCIDLCRSFLNAACYTDAVEFLVQLIAKNPSYLSMTAVKLIKLIKKKARGNGR